MKVREEARKESQKKRDKDKQRETILFLEGQRRSRGLDKSNIVIILR